MEQVLLAIIEMIVWVFTGSSQSNRPNSIRLRLMIAFVGVVILGLLFWWLSNL